MMVYNTTVADTYRSNLAFSEGNRRIVNPGFVDLSDEELIKKHRVFLQGHVHDAVLRMAYKVYQHLGKYPLLTIHDSAIWALEDEKEISYLKSVLKEIGPGTIDTYQN
jgi:hypothetical protein